MVQNLMDKHPPFEHRIQTTVGIRSAFDIKKTNLGRFFSITLTKTW